MFPMFLPPHSTSSVEQPMMVHNKSFRLKVTCFSSEGWPIISPRWRRSCFAVINFGIFIYHHQLQLNQSSPRSYNTCMPIDPAVYEWYTAKQRPDRGCFFFFPSCSSWLPLLKYFSLFYDNFCSPTLIPLFFVLYFVFYSKINSCFFRSNGGGGRTISTNQRPESSNPLVTI